jgi:hypothetical protein
MVLRIIFVKSEKHNFLLIEDWKKTRSHASARATMPSIDGDWVLHPGLGRQKIIQSVLHLVGRSYRIKAKKYKVYGREH